MYLSITISNDTSFRRKIQNWWYKSFNFCSGKFFINFKINFSWRKVLEKFQTTFTEICAKKFFKMENLKDKLNQCCSWHIFICRIGKALKAHKFNKIFPWKFNDIFSDKICFFFHILCKLGRVWAFYKNKLLSQNDKRKIKSPCAFVDITITTHSTEIMC